MNEALQAELLARRYVVRRLQATINDARRAAAETLDAEVSQQLLDSIPLLQEQIAEHNERIAEILKN